MKGLGGGAQGGGVTLKYSLKRMFARWNAASFLPRLFPVVRSPSAMLNARRTIREASFAAGCRGLLVIWSILIASVERIVAAVLTSGMRRVPCTEENAEEICLSWSGSIGWSTFPPPQARQVQGLGGEGEPTPLMHSAQSTIPPSQGHPRIP